MPGIMLERPKMTRSMYQSLKRHIMKDREKKKQAEQEHDEAIERAKREKEQRRKKEQEDSLTLEQTKEQITVLKSKLEVFKTQKHDLFSQLKKALHQEDESRKRAQMKEQNELMQMQQTSYGQGMSGHPIFMQGHMTGRPKFMQTIPSMVHGMKRQRSPSPPPSTGSAVYQHYSQPAAKYQATSSKPEPYSSPHASHTPQKNVTYPSSSTHVTYVSQSGQSAYQQTPPHSSTGQSSATKYQPNSQSAFSSYPNHYAHPSQQQKPMGTEHYPKGYHLQRAGQQGYITSPSTGSSGLPLQQQLEQASQKSGFTDDSKYKMQQSLRHLTNAPLASPQHTQQTTPQSSSSPAAMPKGGSIVSGYPVPRTQHSAPSNQQPATTQAYTNPHSTTPRHGYPTQQPRCYP